MTLTSLYESIKFWLPIITAVSIAYKVFYTIRKNVTEWGDSLLHNHLHTIQEETKLTNTLLRELIAALTKDESGS